MASAIVGALRVVLGADTAAFESGLKGAASKMDSFAAGMARAGAAVAVGMTAAAAALAVAIKGAVNSADELGKMAQKVGLPVEELSKLKHAADLSGVGTEELGKSLGKLSKTMVEAAAKPTSEAANAFRALGVSVKNSDGTLKSSSEVMSDVAEKFAGMNDGAGKTAVAMAIFGRAGAALIPLLNAGRDGLKEMKEEAEKLGIVIDKDTAKAAEGFNDNLTRLGRVKDGIVIKIMAGMVPALDRMSASMVRAAKDSEGMKSIGSIIGDMFAGVFDEIEKFRLAITRIPIEWAAFRKAMQAPIFTAEFTKAWSDFSETLKESDRLLQNLSIVQQTAHLADAFGPVATKTKEATKQLTDFNYQVMAGKNPIDKYLDSVTKSIAAQDAEAQAVGASAGVKERLKVINEGLAFAEANRIPITEALILRLRKQGNAAGDAAMRLQGMQLVHQNLAPGELFRTEMENNRLAMVAVGATSEQIARQAERDADKFGMSWSAIGTNIAGTAGALSQLAGTFAKENKAMGIASKAFGIGQAIINTQIAITKALASLPPPASYAAVALAVAQGAAAVATIASQGFAQGGSFVVPGGKRLTDNMLVPVASGEKVDVTPAGDVGRVGGRGGIGVQTIELRSNPRDFFAHHVRELVDTLNRAAPDGYVLKMATT